MCGWYFIWYSCFITLTVAFTFDVSYHIWCCYICRKNANGITGNVHIGYRRPDSTCGVSPTPAHCASAVLPVIHSPQRTLPIWQVLAVQVLIFLGQMLSCGSVGGVLTQE